MNLKALITALVLAGTSTAALANPLVRDHRDDASAQIVRDHRDDLHKRPSWMVIASSGQLSRGRDVIAANARSRRSSSSRSRARRRSPT